MIKADDVRHLETASPDYAKTEALKAEFRKGRRERSPFFFTRDYWEDREFLLVRYVTEHGVDTWLTEAKERLKSILPR